MNTQKEVKLSSNWTSFGLYAAGIFTLFLLAIGLFAVIEYEFNERMLLGGVLLLLLVVLVIYQFLYACDARIVGDKIVLKKKFRRAKSYSFDKIGYPDSFQLKKTKYITVEMKNDDGTFETYLIINTRSFLFPENKDAERVLINLRNIARMQK
ncbi:hypothetical protein [Aquimarina spongiae]|uniref:Uncharacterized protein n=1 Tax=Aquimarina spongiae TaxID=570521 RepID=A0A1M6CIZ9_9FLAO|nr:hypothetical protein [Aquimarina spongiae]SHI61002.1 hypothetical protein SAMN04488508_102141 [Aquimarina spongiae]